MYCGGVRQIQHSLCRPLRIQKRHPGAAVAPREGRPSNHMKFKLIIAMDNAAFEDNAGLEIGWLLEKVARKAENAGQDLLDPLWRCGIVDRYGNKVGEATVEKG